MKMSEIVCRVCGKNAHLSGGYLGRVNAKGEPGIWECRPRCDADLPQDAKLLLAIHDEVGK